MAEGERQDARGQIDQPYLGDGDPGPYGGGTYTQTGLEPTIRDYENVFGPAARDIKFDLQRSKRHQRWHLPDALKGPNPFLTDRIDGLITDATNSPFTTIILPYKYIENPDAKLKWNVWSFDEGMASRVPYESAARVLTQTKKSFAGYVVRQGLAITMEHNFMKSPAGMENFRNQLKQLVGSIQYSNDLDVHMALIQAPSYARTIAEKYQNSNKTPLQLCREYLDLFGIIQKTPNALDILIEEAKQTLRNWGGTQPTFLLTNGKLTMQLQMSPERTSYVTQGYDGMKRLRTGPDIESYRGLSIIKSRCFATEQGLIPRDPLCRRVRVAEYYRVIPDRQFAAYQLYDQSKDTWFELTVRDLYNYSELLDQPPAINLLPYNGPKSLTASVTTIGIHDWTTLPFQSKITRMTGASNVHITSDKERLELNSICGSDQDMTKLTLIMEEVLTGDGDTAGFQNTLNWSSAWFGGGLFCDTTSHILPGNRNNLSAPVANWTYIALNPETKAAYSKLSADLRTTFEALRPNDFEFAWDGAHSIANLSVHDQMCPDAIVGGAFANVHLSRSVVSILTSNVPGIQFDMIRKYHDFLIPCKLDSVELQKDHNADRAPWKSLLMVYLMSRVHPEADVRRQSRDALQKYLETAGSSTKEFEDAITGYASEYMGKEARSSTEASTLLDDKMKILSAKIQTLAQNTGANNALLQQTSTASRTSNAAVTTYGSSLPKNYPHVLNVFAIVMAKRFFCGARRFHKGGLEDDGTAATYGLSILSRQNAFIASAAAGKPAPARRGLRGFSQKRPGKAGFLNAGSEVSPEESFEYADDDEYYAYEYVIIRPNIEHEMLGVIMGKGGTEDLGATLWGQTELSCYDDSQHGVWGMSYKYHERAQVFNEKNMIRIWDIAFNGYNGGMDDSRYLWTKDDMKDFREATNDISKPYTGKSMIVMRFAKDDDTLNRNWPSPIVFYEDATNGPVTADPECIHNVLDDKMRVFTGDYEEEYQEYRNRMPNFGAQQRLRKPAGHCSAVDETSSLSKLAFQGSLRGRLVGNGIIDLQTGCGHLGPSYVGVASVREGKGFKQQAQPQLGRLV